MPTRRLHFFSQSRPLDGTLTLPGAGRAPVAILCHGFSSYDDDLGAFTRLADALARERIASFHFSFSGSDPYPDRGTIRPASQWVADCVAAVSLLRQEEGIDPARIGLLGVSVGGGVVVQAAACSLQVRCVVALAPVADGRAWLHNRWLITRSQEAWGRFVAQVEADQERVVRGEPSGSVANFDVQALPDETAWKQFLVRFPRVLKDMTLTSVADTFLFRPLGFADAVGQPLLVVHGDADESVPLDHGRWIFERAKGPKEMHVLPGAPHCCWETLHEPEVFRLSTQWLRRWLA